MYGSLAGFALCDHDTTTLRVKPFRLALFSSPARYTRVTHPLFAGIFTGSAGSVFRNSNVVPLIDEAIS